MWSPPLLTRRPQTAVYFDTSRVIITKCTLPMRRILGYRPVLSFRVRFEPITLIGKTINWRPIGNRWSDSPKKDHRSHRHQLRVLTRDYLPESWYPCWRGQVAQAAVTTPVEVYPAKLPKNEVMEEMILHQGSLYYRRSTLPSLGGEHWVMERPMGQVSPPSVTSLVCPFAQKQIMTGRVIRNLAVARYRMRVKAEEFF